MHIQNSSYIFFMQQLQLACNTAQVSLELDVEYYLASRLEKSVKDLEVSSNNHILRLLEENYHKTHEQKIIADNCLIISGMFPMRSLQIGAGSIIPIIWSGKQAYYLQYGLTKELIFLDLADNFVRHMDILLLMRHQIHPSIPSSNLIKQLMQVNSQFPKYIQPD